ARLRRQSPRHALGRGVEERLLSWVADRAETLGCSTVRMPVEHTVRNAPARRLAARLLGGASDAQRVDVSVTPNRLREFRSWDTSTNGEDVTG
ncbi:hypothetical protein AB0346_28600, partial [Nocardia beijingensis]|uniref:hypothetical protein n=1 Tax=Nocardia beijingensis TaxID=95162 RepID=UPI00344C629F